MAPDRSRGKRVRCSYCGTTLKVPDAKKDYFADKGLASKKAMVNEEEYPPETQQ